MKVANDALGEVTGEGCEVFLAAASARSAPDSCFAHRKHSHTQRCMSSVVLVMNIIREIHQWLMMLSSFSLLFLLYFQTERYFQNSRGSLQVQASN